MHPEDLALGQRGRGSGAHHVALPDKPLGGRDIDQAEIVAELVPDHLRRADLESRRRDSQRRPPLLREPVHVRLVVPDRGHDVEVIAVGLASDVVL